MTKLAKVEIKKMEAKILMMEDLICNYINSKSQVKLSWAEINTIELNKLEKLISKIRTTYLNMEAQKLTIINSTASITAKVINPILIESALFNSTIETKNQEPENKQNNEGQKKDFVFYE